MTTVAGEGLPRGPRMPAALQALGWAARPLPFMDRCAERYGDVFTLRIANAGDWVFLSDPEDIKRVFTGEPASLRAGEANAVLEPVVGSRSVVLLDEPDHMAHRKLMLAPFHGERMQRYSRLMVDVTSSEVDSWPTGEPLALWPRMQAITLEVIMQAVFGINDPGRSAEMRSALLGMLEWTTDRRRLASLAMLGPRRIKTNRAFRQAMDPVDRALRQVIRLRRSEADLKDREDILSMLLDARYEDGSPMSDEDLRDELITLLIAGHETTATALAWTFERLLRHPEKLERLQEEVLAGEEVYLDAVIKETLRLRPVVMIVLRRLSEPLELTRHTIPAGAAVAPCIYLMHLREDIYPEARSFRPERFIERPAGTYTWIPFGGGVRRCLGASFALFEMRAVLKTVLSQVRLHAVEQRSERMVRRAITLSPEEGARAIVSRRGRAAVARSQQMHESDASIHASIRAPD